MKNELGLSSGNRELVLKVSVMSCGSAGKVKGFGFKVSGLRFQV
jgi:hypothetical protein